MPADNEHIQGGVNVETSVSSECERIVAELDASVDFPEEAMRSAQAHREEIVPYLIRAIEQATAQKRAGTTVETNTHWLAVYLLWEFRAKSALPAVLDALSLPGEEPYDLFGDAITEDFHRILAVLAEDSPELLEAVLASRSHDQFVRSAAAGAIVNLTRLGHMTREDVCQRLIALFKAAIEMRDAEGVDAILWQLDSFHVREALDDIREAYRLELADPQYDKLENIEQRLNEDVPGAEEMFLREPPVEIEDAVEEVRPLFAQREYQPAMDLDDWYEEDEVESEAVERDPWAPEPIRNTFPRVGRNEPCPCGSGKKYKKCCGGRSA